MPKYAMVVDQRRCVACMACVIACKKENDVPPGQFRIAFSLLALKPESSLRVGPQGIPNNKKGISGLLVGDFIVPEAPTDSVEQTVDIGELLVGSSNEPPN